MSNMLEKEEIKYFEYQYAKKKCQINFVLPFWIDYIQNVVWSIKYVKQLPYSIQKSTQQHFYHKQTQF